MNRIPSNKDEFLRAAIRAYDPNGISLTEFRLDVRNLRKIRKDVSILISTSEKKKEIKVRSLLNRFLIAYNQFGSSATELIFYFMTDDERNAATLFILKLGRCDDLVEKYHLNIDNEIFKELSKI